MRKVAENHAGQDGTVRADWQSAPGLEIQAVIDAIQVAIAVVDDAGKIAHVNNQLETLFGYGRGDLSGRGIEILIPHPGYRESFFSLPHDQRTGAGQDLPALRRDGGQFPAEIRVNPIVTTGGQFLLASIIDITERKRAEETVKRSEQRLSIALESPNMGIWELDLISDTAVRNLQHDRIFGYSSLQPEWGAEILLTHVVPEDRDLVRRQFEEAFRTGNFYVECRILWHDQSLHWISAQATAFRDGNGTPVKMMGAVQDITERKTTGERFQLVVEAAPNAMIMVGAGGLISLVNAQTEKLFGYNRLELLGQPMEMLVPERFRANHGGRRNGFFAAPATRSMDAGRDLFGLRKDGSEVPVEIGLNPIASRDGQFVLASIIDITERKTTDERFQLVVEAAPNAMIMVGAGGLISLVNSQTEKLFGYDRQELLGQSMETLVPERFRSNHGGHRSGFFAAPATRSMGAGRDLFGLRKDGSEVPVEIGLSPIATPDGQFVLASIIDITQRKLFEAELQTRAAEMERLVYTVSHDLKSPLITIKSYVTMIEQDLGGGAVDRARADLRRVAKAADKMNNLLEDLLALSRVGRADSPPESVPFGLLVEEALELVAGGLYDRHVHVEVASGLPTVTVDRRRLVEVLQNLIDNAAKFMGSQAAPEIRIGASNGVGMGKRFFVKDNGVGVEPRHHQRIFGLFDKLDATSGGSGAGLAIVKRIIETHGGRIWIESPGSGGGSTFWFTLREPTGK